MSEKNLVNKFLKKSKETNNVGNESSKTIVVVNPNRDKPYCGISIFSIF